MGLRLCRRSDNEHQDDGTKAWEAIYPRREVGRRAKSSVGVHHHGNAYPRYAKFFSKTQRILRGGGNYHIQRAHFSVWPFTSWGWYELPRFPLPLRSLSLLLPSPQKICAPTSVLPWLRLGRGEQLAQGSLAHEFFRWLGGTQRR